MLFITDYNPDRCTWTVCDTDSETNYIVGENQFKTLAYVYNKKKEKPMRSLTHNELKILFKENFPKGSYLDYIKWKKEFFRYEFSSEGRPFYISKSSLDSTEKTVPAVNPTWGPQPLPCEQKDCAMNAQMNIGVNVGGEREYLIDRLRQTRDDKRSAAYKTFNMNGTPKPKTMGELKEYLAKGFLVIPTVVSKQYGDEYAIYNWRDYVSFENPELKADEAGFDKFEAEMKKAYVAAKDIIKVKDAAAGLEALQAFEAKTFH